MLRNVARALLLSGLAAVPLGLAGCAGAADALRITGPSGSGAASPAGSAPSATELLPGVSNPPLSNPGQDDTAIQPPGVPSDLGNRYAPSVGPTYGSDGRFYGYN
jgi:hypothetical protein